MFPGSRLSPQLESVGWERRQNLARLIHFDRWGAQDQRRAAELLAPDGQ